MRKFLFLKNSIFLKLILIFLFFSQKSFAQLEIPKDIFIAATVQPWLYLEVFPLDLTLSPDLVSPEGVFNIGETQDVSFFVGTSNPSGWEIKMRGKNNGLKNLATGYVISSVFSSSTLVAGKDGYGAQATSTLAGVEINPIYDYYGTNTVGEVIKDYRMLAKKESPNSTQEVLKMKIKASASIFAPASLEYSDEVEFTILPLL